MNVHGVPCIRAIFLSTLTRVRMGVRFARARFVVTIIDEDAETSVTPATLTNCIADVPIDVRNGPCTKVKRIPKPFTSWTM